MTGPPIDMRTRIAAISIKGESNSSAVAAMTTSIALFTPPPTGWPRSL
jgi:hypothetical protein